MKQPIVNRWTREPKYVADLGAEYEGQSYAVRMGAAVKLAINADADLTDAYLADAILTGADLTRADLSRADLTGAILTGAILTEANLTDAILTGADIEGTCLIDGGQRADGYRFVGWVQDSALMIRAGCRNFTIDEAHAHWGNRTYRDRALGDESLAKIRLIEDTARIRGLIGGSDDHS